MDIGLLQTAVRLGKVKITDHADEESWNDRLSLADIYTATLDGEVIEDYPADRPYPSCLVFGRTAGGEPVHCVWAYNDQTEWAVLITVYRPDPDRWIDWKTRRSRQ